MFVASMRKAIGYLIHFPFPMISPFPRYARSHVRFVMLQFAPLPFPRYAEPNAGFVMLQLPSLTSTLGPFLFSSLQAALIRLRAIFIVFITNHLLESIRRDSQTLAEII